MGERHKKRKNSQNNPDFETDAPVLSESTSQSYHHDRPTSRSSRNHHQDHKAKGSKIDIQLYCCIILNATSAFLLVTLKLTWKILTYLFACFRTLLSVLLTVTIILYGVFGITFTAYYTIVEFLRDYAPEQFIHPFQVLNNIFLVVAPPLVDLTARYVYAPLNYFATGDRQKYDELIDCLNALNDEGFLHEHLERILQQRQQERWVRDFRLEDDVDDSDTDSYISSEDYEIEEDSDLDDIYDERESDLDVESELTDSDCCPCCGTKPPLEEGCDIKTSLINDLSEGPKKMELMEHLITDQILKDFKHVWMHPECGLRIRSFMRAPESRIVEYSYCLNDKFEDRVFFKNQSDPKNAIVEFKPCSVLHATSPQPSMEEPFLKLARPTDIPLVMRQSRSYDAHLRYHGIEQLYLLYLRHDLRGILEEVGLLDVCMDTIARKHADARTRHLCTIMIRECLSQDLRFNMTNSLFASLHESSPVAYLKKGPEKLNKLLAPYKVSQKAASEKYVIAFNLWTTWIDKVFALPWAQNRFPSAYKKNVVKKLAEGIRICKKGSTVAAYKCKSLDLKIPHRVFRELADEVLKESADNLDAHLVAIFCLELERDYDEAVMKSDEALRRFPDDPWVLVLRAQSTQKLNCCEKTDEHVVNAMTIAWHKLQKEHTYTMECYETFLQSLFKESKYSLAYDVALEAVENVPIDDDRYSNIAYLLAILHLCDLHHLNQKDDPEQERLDPVKGFVKYYKLGQEAQKIYTQIWNGMRESRYFDLAIQTADYLKKFLMYPIEMRTLMNNIPYYCHKVRSGNHGNMEGRMKQCNVCGVPEVEKVLRKCSRCRMVHYCSVTCQQQDWPKHKTNCKKV